MAFSTSRPRALSARLMSLRKYPSPVSRNPIAPMNSAKIGSPASTPASALTKITITSVPEVNMLSVLKITARRTSPARL